MRWGRQECSVQVFGQVQFRSAERVHVDHELLAGMARGDGDPETEGSNLFFIVAVSKLEGQLLHGGAVSLQVGARVRSKSCGGRGFGGLPRVGGGQCRG